MSFGSGFPDDFRLAQIRRRLKPGVVIKLFRRMDDGRLHEKRFVVLHLDAHTTTLRGPMMLTDLKITICDLKNARESRGFTVPPTSAPPRLAI